MNLKTHDDCLPQLNIINLLFQMFCDAELSQKILIRLTYLSSL